MNRKIKFRAWTGKQMMYQDNQYLASFIRRVVLQICLEHGSAQQHESYLPSGGIIDEYLQQYTGLEDKNGKPIYEGDIVTWHAFEATFIRVVQWIDDRAMFLPNDMKDEVEVIGNIYEHPSLLQKGDS